MDRTIKEATVKRSHYDDHDQLRNHLINFISYYNFGCRLKTLKGLTLYKFICKQWTNRAAKVQPKSDPPNAGTEHLPPPNVAAVPSDLYIRLAGVLPDRDVISAASADGQAIEKRPP